MKLFRALCLLLTLVIDFHHVAEPLCNVPAYLIEMAQPDRFNVDTSLSKNWVHLENKFVGTGHPDITRHQWATNHHRDTAASMIGHADMLQYIAAAENISVGRAKYNLIQSMVQPCGPPPATKANK